MINDPVVTIDHVRKAGLCVRGAKQWCEHHGLNFRQVLEGKYRASQIEALGDALGNKVVKVAREGVQ